MAAKKHAKKPAKKHAKKPAKKLAKKLAKKPAKKLAKKPAKKIAAAPKARKAAKKPARKHKNPHPVVHWEIQSLNPERLFEFYGHAFGWEINAANPMNYGMVSSAGGADSINGGIGGTMGGSSKVVVYTAVPDIDTALARITEHGGEIVMPRTDVGPVIMALYKDPEGNTMGIIEG